MHNVTRIAKVNYLKPKNLPAKHPFLDDNTHADLLEYLMQRLKSGDEARRALIPRMIQIDHIMSGWIKHNADDQRRLQTQAETGEPAPVKMNLPLAYVHIEDMMTYFAATFAPNRGMFYHTADPDGTETANQLIKIMNSHAIYAKYYRQIILTLFGLLKYNRGGFHVYWSEEMKPKLMDQDGESILVESIGWAGNRLESIDMYNFIYDPDVELDSLPDDGEFAAMVSKCGTQYIQRKASRGEYFNCESELVSNSGMAPLGAAAQFYRDPPEVARMANTASTQGSSVDWRSILSGGHSSSSGSGHELVKMYIRLNPTEFNLLSPAQAKTRDRLELWCFTILNGRRIVEAKYVNNVHGQIPTYCGLMHDDLMRDSQKSSAEILAPLQDFSSELLNTHVGATLAAMFGGIVYDPAVVDMRKIPKGARHWRLPTEPGAAGKDIRNHVWERPANVDTGQTLGQLESMMGLINQFFPTQSAPSQIANIDRAVDSQVAAVSQGANRRQQMGGKSLDDKLFNPVRFALYHNITQFLKDGTEYFDFSTGTANTVNVSEFKNTDLPYLIGQGLKALDRQATQSMMQSLIFALIQAPKASERIDLLKMLDYWSSTMDIETNMKQFELTPDELAARQQQQAGPEGMPITPATNPGAVTTPIYDG